MFKACTNDAIQQMCQTESIVGAISSLEAIWFSRSLIMTVYEGKKELISTPHL